ncbi:hybrid sensor histidine kinase/response regulator [Foetidibacter luteolus]|uniref:hybrid sensor histidine kinase/response regulator n=1 Tax=Foetidibacter luteolus TaxID=2608880 RepID=UPI00129BDD84|nr:ATP-binding protein [Foetidibacter luteolus]
MSQDNKIRILLVEDDEIDFFLFSNYIRETGDERLLVEWCDDYSKALFKMADNAYDLYFVDYRLGESTALQLLEEMRKFGFNAPVIVLTGKGSRNVDIQAMERGATDYLVKAELNAEKLERCIRYALDRSKAVATIKESENKYRSLFEKSADAIFIADRFLFLREVNNAACMLFETDEETLTTHNLYHFLKEGKTGRALYHSLENNEHINNLEIDVKTERQRNRVCLLTISKINYEEQELYHCILRDITELKRAENVNMQMQKMDATEKLIRMLGHEIRNPLTNIELAADSLIQQVSDEEDKVLLDIIRRNSGRINHLISQLIDSTKSTNFDFELASLKELLEEALSASQDSLAMNNIQVTRHYDAGTPLVLADRQKLKIALGNLIINAVDAMQGTEGKLLDITIKNDEDCYILEITDNGCGIPKDFMPRLFEPFSTLKKSGLGLGLSSVFTILNLHQANIDVASELGKGATFSIAFKKQGHSNTNSKPGDEFFKDSATSKVGKL